MRYGSDMKEGIVERVLPPSEESVTEVSRETGVSAATIRLSTSTGYWHTQSTA